MKKNIKDFTEAEREYCEHCDEKGFIFFSISISLLILLVVQFLILIL